MKKSTYIALILITLVNLGLKYPNKSEKFDTPFECKLTTTKTIYKLDELPELKVEIINNSGKDVYLIGSLDASDQKWRRPYCYYTIESTNQDSVPPTGRCGMMNSLRSKDFVLIKDSESLDPFTNVDDQGFFGAGNVQNLDNFKNPGIYKIQFHYSTLSQKMTEYNGDIKDESLMKLFDQVPHIELESNVLEIEYKNR